jgi:hypothetical protein
MALVAVSHVLWEGSVVSYPSSQTYVAKKVVELGISVMVTMVKAGSVSVKSGHSISAGVQFWICQSQIWTRYQNLDTLKGGDPQQRVVTQETHQPLGMAPVYHRWANWCSSYQPIGPTQRPLSWSSNSGCPVQPPLLSLKRLQPSFTHCWSTRPLLICLGGMVPINCILDSISGTKHGAELLCCIQLQSGKGPKLMSRFLQWVSIWKNKKWNSKSKVSVCRGTVN